MNKKSKTALISSFESLRKDIPYFRVGDTIRVFVKVQEEIKQKGVLKKEKKFRVRLQAYEGICIARRGGEAKETFTVRKISSGIGIERIFPLHSPVVDHIEIIHSGKVRRAKLYYLRDRVGKAASSVKRRAPKSTKASKRREAAAAAAKAKKLAINMEKSAAPEPNIESNTTES